MAADAESHAIPFRLHGGHLIIVQGSIGPLTELNLVIDTGSSSTVISEQVAKRLKLKGHTRKVLALGKRVPIQEVVLPVLEIGSLQFSQVPAWVRSLAGLEQSAKSPLRVDALIGLDLLKRTDLTIDYETGKLIFGPVTHSEQVLAFYKDLPFLTVHLRVAGQPLRLLLDSGAGQPVDLLIRTRSRSFSTLAERSGSRRFTWRKQLWETPSGKNSLPFFWRDPWKTPSPTASWASPHWASGAFSSISKMAS